MVYTYLGEVVQWQVELVARKAVDGDLLVIGVQVPQVQAHLLVRQRAQEVRLQSGERNAKLGRLGPLLFYLKVYDYKVWQKGLKWRHSYLYIKKMRKISRGQ